MPGEQWKTHRTSAIDDHRDQRGFVLNPFEHIPHTGSVSNCHAFSMEPGSVRGDHTHPGRNEEVLLLAGELTVSFPETGDRIRLATGEPLLLQIGPGVHHTFENNGRRTAIVICWSSERDADCSGPDTVWKKRE